MSATWDSSPSKPRSRAARPVRVAIASALWMATLAVAATWPLTFVATAERLAATWSVGIFAPFLWLTNGWERP